MDWDSVVDALGEDGSYLLARLLLVLLILVITWLARQIVTAIMPRLVKRFTQRTETQIDDRIVEALRPPLRLLITLFGFWAILLVLEPSEALSDLTNRVMTSLVTAAIFWALYRGADLLIDLFQLVSQRTTRTAAPLIDDKLIIIVRQIGKAIVVLLAFGAIMEAWGYSMSGLVAGLGIGGLAVALAAQDALANLIGYFVILADNPFIVGEYIVLSNLSGTIESIGFRSTRVRAPDQSLVSVPNNTIMTANVTNWSRLTKRRLDMTLGLSYGSSPGQVLSVVQAIREMLQNHDLVQADSVTVQFVAFSDNSLDVMIICFMKTPAWADFQAAKQDINLKIMDILAERGVEIALPSTNVIIEQPVPTVERPDMQLVTPPKPEPTVSTAADSPVPDDAAN
ncbi:MAG: mechanosensitive ion channel family protein [Anaerolineae bacterium]|nr:mechanosensitive ion channel family protein [Anaerolineae bacterium]